VKNSFQSHHKQVCINKPYRHLTMPSQLPWHFAMTKFRLTSAPWLSRSTLSKGWSRHKWIHLNNNGKMDTRDLNVCMCTCVCVCVCARATSCTPVI
jgi:hypothetical protein